MTAPRRRTRRRAAVRSLAALDAEGRTRLADALANVHMLNDHCLYVDGKACDAVAEVSESACEACFAHGREPVDTSYRDEWREQNRVEIPPTRTRFER